jgi:hypothetical protein
MFADLTRRNPEVIRFCFNTFSRHRAAQQLRIQARYFFGEVFQPLEIALDKDYHGYSCQHDFGV